MFKLYQEHENFGEYSAFNLALGRLEAIDKEKFEQFSDTNLKFINPNSSPLHTRFPRRIYFQITRNCQLSCEYCYVKAGPKQPHLERHVICNIVDYLGEQGLMEVRLTGGEATTHPNFIEICERFFKKNIYISLGTNGLWSNPIKEFLASQPYFCLAVTIDGSEHSHQAYRRGSFNALYKNLRELRARNPYIRIRINMVVTKSNKHQFTDLVRFAEEITAESLTFLPLRPRMSEPQLLQEVLSAEEFREVVYHATVSLKDKPGEDIIQQDVTHKAIFDRYKKRKVCPAGRERLNLAFNASEKKITTFACSFSPAMEGAIDARLREHFIAGTFGYEEIEKLKAIWEEDAYWDVFRDRNLKTEACMSCASFGNNCGGSGYCHIQNHKYFELQLNQDINAQLHKQMKTLPVWCEKKI
jgi:MoaA/NifB/PqqE/SkfB family radical SAM enzyme